MRLREKLIHYTNNLGEVDLKQEAIATIEHITRYMDEDELLHHSRPLAIAYLALTEDDSVPVTRCKDCAHYDLGVCLKIYSDGNAQKDSWQSRNPDDFCSYGERKGNNPGLFTIKAINEKFAKI